MLPLYERRTAGDVSTGSLQKTARGVGPLSLYTGQYPVD